MIVESDSEISKYYFHSDQKTVFRYLRIALHHTKNMIDKIIASVVGSHSISHIDGLVLERRISTANTMEFCLSCTNLSISYSLGCVVLCFSVTKLSVLWIHIKHLSIVDGNFMIAKNG